MADTKPRELSWQSKYMLSIRARLIFLALLGATLRTSISPQIYVAPKPAYLATQVRRTQALDRRHPFHRSFAHSHDEQMPRLGQGLASKAAE